MRLVDGLLRAVRQMGQLLLHFAHQGNKCSSCVSGNIKHTDKGVDCHKPDPTLKMPGWLCQQGYLVDWTNKCCQSSTSGFKTKHAACFGMMTYAAHSSQNERALQSKTDPADAQEHKEQRHHLEARLEEACKISKTKVAATATWWPVFLQSHLYNCWTPKSAYHTVQHSSRTNQLQGTAQHQLR